MINATGSNDLCVPKLTDILVPLLDRHSFEDIIFLTASRVQIFCLIVHYAYFNVNKKRFYRNIKRPLLSY